MSSEENRFGITITTKLQNIEYKKNVENKISSSLYFNHVLYLLDDSQSVSLQQL